MTPRQRASQIVIAYNTHKLPCDGWGLTDAIEKAIATAILECDASWAMDLRKATNIEDIDEIIAKHLNP